MEKVNGKRPAKSVLFVRKTLSQKPYSVDIYLLSHLPELDHMAILPSREAAEVSILPGYITSLRNGGSGSEGEKDGYWVSDYQCLPHEAYHLFS